MQNIMSIQQMRLLMHLETLEHIIALHSTVHILSLPVKVAPYLCLPLNQIALADNEKLQHCHDEKHVVRVNVVNGLDSTL